MHWKNIAEHGGCNERSEAMGFLNKWLNKDRLKLLCSFVDVCEIFAKVAWKFQRNQITIMDVPRVKEVSVAELSSIVDDPKPGTGNTSIRLELLCHLYCHFTL